MSSNHALPATPGEQNGRPRAKSSFSFHSHKSSSSGGNNKLDLRESHSEKESKRLHSKADPSMALNEAEPSAVALQKVSLAPLRSIQHLDIHGNPIADPDRNNPTRSRWERPLDTIRAFEAAIDGNYSRKSYMRSESVAGSVVGDAQSTYNRRSSYFGGDERSRYSQNGYGGRAQSYRPDSYYGDGRGNGMGRPESHYIGDHGPSNGYTPNRARYPRTASEPHFNNYSNGGVYPIPGQQQSYETVTTASGSGSSPDTVGYSTNPSSENSSRDRIAPLPKEPAETYGFDGFENTPQYAPPGAGIEQYVQSAAQRQGDGYPDQKPTPPRKDVARGPIKLGTTSGNAGRPEPAQPAQVEKRKSWFGKRFSKNA